MKQSLGSRPYKGNRLARGFLGCWPMNERAGDKVYDLSGNGNTGTFQGTVPSWIPGRFGPAVLLPGTDEYIDCGGSNSLNITSGYLTIEVSAYFNQVANQGQLVNRGLYNTDGYYIEQYRIAGADAISFCIHSGGPKHAITSNGTLTIGNHHIVGVANGTTPMRVFIDGVEPTYSTQDVGGDIKTASRNLYIGRYATDTIHFDGKINYVRVYKRPFSPSEIALLYREPFCMFERAAIELSSIEPEVGLSIPVAMRTYRNYRAS